MYLGPWMDPALSTLLNATFGTQYHNWQNNLTPSRSVDPLQMFHAEAQSNSVIPAQTRTTGSDCAKA